MRELTPDLYFLFREGMELRKKDVVEIFGTGELHLWYPDLIIKTDHFTFRGSEYLYDIIPTPVEYDAERFVGKAPNIYNYGYKVSAKLYAGLLNLAPYVDGKSQVYHGFMSGILKYKRNRFYYDPEGIRQLKLYEAQEGIE